MDNKGRGFSISYSCVCGSNLFALNHGVLFIELRDELGSQGNLIAWSSVHFHENEVS